ncbi:hypothetical protein V6N12_032342 [Hibiscus sabdariffa]|uniref:Uncharacterized protein n=1 Tax=Hibiscus sabdariffa TaxID=183260 RepID=A0ABR2CCB7_9ROSI
MISLIHVAKHVKSGALDLYGVGVLYACRQNIASADEIWQLVDELVEAYKEAEVRNAGEEIETGILNLLLMLQQYPGLRFEAAWDKHKDDPNLISCL